jgi:hypothetical protein
MVVLLCRIVELFSDEHEFDSALFPKVDLFQVGLVQEDANKQAKGTGDAHWPSPEVVSKPSSSSIFMIPFTTVSDFTMRSRSSCMRYSMADDPGRVA